MARIGLSAKIKYLFNPLPPVTEKELFKRADLDCEPSPLLPFALVWSYGHGLEKEIVSLPPGATFPLRGNEADAALRDLKQFGVILIDNPDAIDPDAEIKAVRIARNRYRDNGKSKISSLRKLRNLTREEMEDEYRHDYWPYYYNQAAADVLTEYLKVLEGLKNEEKDGSNEADVVGATG